MKWCLDEVLWALNGLATQVPNAYVLSFLLLSLLHLGTRAYHRFS